MQNLLFIKSVTVPNSDIDKDNIHEIQEFKNLRSQVKTYREHSRDTYTYVILLNCSFDSF